MNNSSYTVLASLAVLLTACGPTRSPEPQETELLSNASALLNTADSLEETDAPTAGPKKVYTEADIEWEYAEDAVPYKAKVVAGINKILRENARCADVQTTSLYRAEGFSKANPVFYIQCDAKEGLPFGVTFNVDDVDDADTKFAAASIIKESVAWEACKNATEQDANGLRSLSFPALFNGNFIPHNDGRATITMAFTAKNGLGIAGDYKVICSFQGQRFVDHVIKTN